MKEQREEGENREREQLLSFHTWRKQRAEGENRELNFKLLSLPGSFFFILGICMISIVVIDR